MNLGANDEPHADLVRDIIARFAAGRAAEFEYKTSGVTPGSSGAMLPVKLIPESLFANDRNGLLIVVVGRGSLVWTGREAMNKFKLINAGIRPMALADDLSHILNRVVQQMATLSAPTETLLITSDTVETA